AVAVGRVLELSSGQTMTTMTAATTMTTTTSAAKTSTAGCRHHGVEACPCWVWGGGCHGPGPGVLYCVGAAADGVLAAVCGYCTGAGQLGAGGPQAGRGWLAGIGVERAARAAAAR